MERHAHAWKEAGTDRNGMESHSGGGGISCGWHGMDWPRKKGMPWNGSGIRGGKTEGADPADDIGRIAAASGWVSAFIRSLPEMYDDGHRCILAAARVEWTTSTSWRFTELEICRSEHFLCTNLQRRPEIANPDPAIESLSFLIPSGHAQMSDHLFLFHPSAGTLSDQADGYASQPVLFKAPLWAWKSTAKSNAFGLDLVQCNRTLNDSSNPWVACWMHKPCILFWVDEPDRLRSLRPLHRYGNFAHTMGLLTSTKHPFVSICRWFNTRFGFCRYDQF